MKGHEFREIRKSLNLTQQDLAYMWDTNNVTISHQENSDKVRTVYADAIRYVAIKEKLSEAKVFIGL